ncbi:hypothetical protein GGR57DRAFT_500280 [Xylariaceae sp. FL1272]|nr:hypothetical protein GGR57DRAFT_500280 [Xylariaceae sp. FL1272]
MATTSASRRPEAFHRPEPKYTRRSQPSLKDQQQQQPPQAVLLSQAARMKRPLDPIPDNLSESLPAKRTRITVEIVARPLVHGFGSKTVQNKSSQQSHQPASKPSAAPPPSQSLPVAPVPKQTPTATTSSTTTTANPPSSPTPVPLPSASTATAAVPPPPAAPPSSTTATNKEHVLTKHQEKVISGIRHELDRLQPSAADASSASTTQGRKLRSQEATRFKSELSAYFPDYDEVIGNDPVEKHFLNIETPIVVSDADLAPSDAAVDASTLTNPTSPGGRDQLPHPLTVRAYGDRLFSSLHNVQPMDFHNLESKYRGKRHLEDPLSDAYYEPSHRKAARLEKSIRNTERGRAQHEKDQIIRLLSDLQGHDWLRTMGVNGVTESRKKSFEPARDHFIKGCQAILDKFRFWSAEEKRRKLEKERAQVEESSQEEDAADEEVQDSDELGDAEDEAEVEDSDNHQDVEMAESIEDSAGELESNGEPPDYSDVDAAARQLHDEAMARAGLAASRASSRSRGEPLPLLPEPARREFTSFFQKRHQRDAAVHRSRRRGRTLLAWGHPIPDMAEVDFDLPDDCIDKDTLKAHERQKRRERRQHKQ